VFYQVLEKYTSFEADLNVMPFCSQFIPMDVINHPRNGSIIYHPSILPRHRGASAINWSAERRLGSSGGRGGVSDQEGEREGGPREEGRCWSGRTYVVVVFRNFDRLREQ